jgi:large subunit ribosomal protein L15
VLQERYRLSGEINMTDRLPRIKTRSKKRKGRGYGSGKGGHTVGRGQKGQKSRNKIGVLFEGLKMKKSLIKRLPLRRGKGKFKAKDKPIIVKLTYLNLLPSSSKVDLDLLIKQGIVDKDDAQKYGVKILGDGELKKKLTIALPISKSAAKKIEKAGGKVVGSNSKP